MLFQLSLALLGFFAKVGIVNAAPTSGFPVTTSGEAFVARDYFYVGGNYVEVGNGHIFSNQMYVEKLSPFKASQPYPLVFIHGQGQTGTNWLNKPDGGSGWASYFLDQGYVVYVIDQTERGRSAWNPSGNTTLTTYSAEIIEQRFTATRNFSLWPQASLHTQWPGSGLMGDPIFDEYYASNVEFQSNTVVQETKMQAAGAALLKKIGPAVLVSHSQGGLMPWLIGDVVPNLVKAIISIEPTGPPFIEAVFSSTSARPWGLTNIPLTYSPSPTNATAPLETQIVANNAPGLASCIIQASPARQLVNLKNIPVLLETSEASYHAVYDGCTFQFLEQAGVPVEWLKLADIGIHGNGHLHFAEKNSHEIAEVLEAWIRKTRARLGVRKISRKGIPVPKDQTSPDSPTFVPTPSELHPNFILFSRIVSNHHTLIHRAAHSYNSYPYSQYTYMYFPADANHTTPCSSDPRVCDLAYRDPKSAIRDLITSTPSLPVRQHPKPARAPIRLAAPSKNHERVYEIERAAWSSWYTTLNVRGILHPRAVPVSH
ncbi:hypothetical protein G7Y89_g3314 [Cudoniella acicularis]|uniref:AB hydrolase-1 domain-containing protein n=1 Tax=Cudoniella acicularis TaxID=354080 RepID=A0A8H4RUL8_9HELO|nr:hypothetical protein G7Y89_g3314 [Cudoniella acicularis]